MNFSIDIQAESGYMACTITGKWVTKELIAFIDTVSAKVKKRKKRGSTRILADMSLVSGPPPEMDRFQLGEYIASVLRNVKIAIVYQKVFKNKFFEDTAVNRGALLRVFPDKPAALQWLLIK
ncbi:MAG: hypothetical protein ABSC53_14965 [Bacteroidota bacterium]